MSQAASAFDFKLATLAGGGAEERFQKAVQDAIENITDPNVDAKAKRRIVVTLTIMPNEEREECALTIDVETKFPARRSAPSTLFIAHRRGVYEAREWHPNQESLFPPEEPPAGVVDIRDNKNKKGAN